MYPFSFEEATFSSRIRLPSTGIRRKRSRKLFQNALQSGTFWIRWGYIISSNPLRAILETFSRWRTGVSLFCLLYLGLFLTQLLVFKQIYVCWFFKLISPGGCRTLSGYFCYRCQDASFSLTFFLPWFWHFKLFLGLWRTSQQYKPTPMKFINGAYLLFRGLIIANTYASSMLSRVSYRFEINSSYTCGRAKTLRVDASNFENGEKSCLFKRIRIRVDRAWVESISVCNHSD